MALCACCSKVSTADSLVLGAIQIMIGIFSVFMWYLLLILYIGQIKGVFGTYEPITYKTGCFLWGIIFIISGVSIIRVARHPSPRLLTCTMIMNILCIIVAVIAVVLTVMELSSFDSVSYRNYGQAKLGREISRVLLGFYPLELCNAFIYTIFGCVDLAGKGLVYVNSLPQRLIPYTCPGSLQIHQSSNAPTAQVSPRGSSRSRARKPSSWSQLRRWNRARGDEGHNRGSRTHSASAAARTSGAEKSGTEGITCEITPL
ncbi:membrane-spanning 4-domains subfamily A member 13 [Eubalaena glacialis]|uniref:membrane-spanning 4-domains subfamily A member 13 n=1 Tax=Eubalaena glacialis TaxID=27606 RepID=UPI002A5A59AC|nr:membrane-spanning 4-domains subfamily A member 13 [Eubalaena glacialis]